MLRATRGSTLPDTLFPARRSSDLWAGLAPYARDRVINRLADLIEQNIPEMAELESIDNGKPRAVSAGYDLPKCVQALRYMAGWATKLSGEHIEPSGAPAGTFHAYVRREPVGVAVKIVPWNRSEEHTSELQ